MKTCPVCYEKYEEVATDGQRYPDVCAACNDAFGIPSPTLEAPPPSPESPPPPEVPPPPPETPAERHTRLTAKARELLILKLCHQELCRRIDADAHHAQMLHLKDKVALRMAAYLRNTLPTEFRTPHPPLSDKEVEHALATHHLLQLKQPSGTASSLSVERVRQLRAQLRGLCSKETEQDAS